MASLRGCPAEAASEFQKICGPYGRQLGRSLGESLLGAILFAFLPGHGARLGTCCNSAEAGKAFRDFFELWKDADPDIPTLKQAKAEYAKLR
jgi:hypothetical protein